MKELKMLPEEKAGGRVGEIIDHCTRLDAEQRYNAKELTEALEALRG